MLVKLIVASLPALIFLILFGLIDKKFIRKKWLPLLIVLIVGAFGSYICYRFEMHFGSYFKKVAVSTYLETLFYALLGVAIFEEGYKWLVSLGAIFLDKKVKTRGILIYTVFASIGFAWFENIVFYAFKYGVKSLFGRMFTAFPSHICDAIWMAYFLILFNKSKGKKKWLFFGLSLVIPTFIHGMYNSFLYQGNPVLMNYHAIYVMIMYIATAFITHKILKESI